jgi:hypothetical protein
MVVGSHASPNGFSGKKTAIKLAGELVLVIGVIVSDRPVQKMFVAQESCLHCGSRGSREFDVIVKEIGSKTTAASTDGSIN